MTRQVAVLLGAMLLVLGCTREADRAGQEEGLRVVATVYPIADLIQQIGGPGVRVDSLLEAGDSPHGVSLSPHQTEMLARADLVVCVGMGLDDWALRAAAAAGRREVVTLAPHLGLVANHGAHGGGHGHSHGPAGDHHDHHHPQGDPHIWLDPVLMQQAADLIAERLSQLDPAGREGFQQRASEVKRQLVELDAFCRERLADLAQRRLVTYHEAFAHFARRYGLEHVALLDATGGGLGPQRLEGMLQYLQEHQVPVLFVEPQFPAERLVQLARAAGVRVAQLDPLGDPRRAGYDGYFPLMRSNAETIARELGR